MKLLSFSLLLVFFTLSGRAQYYYKDQVLTRQTAAQWQIYHDNKVKTVKLSSFEANGQPSEGFTGAQEINADGTLITTHTRTSGTPDSWILAYYTPAGRPLKIVDTSDRYQSTSDYQYDAKGQLSAITNTSIETDNHIKETEQHRWSYDASGKPTGMIKIRNNTDSTFVTFTTDEKGNIAEERSRRNGSALPVVYYYYDDQGQLTDVVRFNLKAGRLLPDYILEYNGSGQPVSMLVVPEGSNDYQKWAYTYNDKKLKTKESCTNRQKQPVGSIEYQYIYK